MEFYVDASTVSLYLQLSCVTLQISADGNVRVVGESFRYMLILHIFINMNQGNIMTV